MDEEDRRPMLYICLGVYFGLWIPAMTLMVTARYIKARRRRRERQSD